MATIGLMPPKGNPADFETATLTVATAKYGSLVIRDTGDNEHDTVKCTTAAGEQVTGVVQSQGDPNNSGLFATGSQVSVAKGGTCEVLFAASEALVKGAKVIASGTAGLAKILGAEADPYWILGECAETRTIGASPGLGSVDIKIQWVAKD